MHFVIFALLSWILLNFIIQYYTLWLPIYFFILGKKIPITLFYLSKQFYDHLKLERRKKIFTINFQSFSYKYLNMARVLKQINFPFSADICPYCYQAADFSSIIKISSASVFVLVWKNILTKNATNNFLIKMIQLYFDSKQLIKYFTG